MFARANRGRETVDVDAGAPTSTRDVGARDDARDGADDDADDDDVDAASTMGALNARTLATLARTGSRPTSPSARERRAGTATESRASETLEIPTREVDYGRGGAGRTGLKPGDVVALVTPEEGYPYACVSEIDEARDGERRYRYAIDAGGKGGNAALRERAETQLEVLQHNGFVGFRSAFARDRLLQATRHARNRLGFVSANFGTWEEWILDEEEKRKLNDGAWTRCEVTLKHRRLDAYRLRVTMVRVGRIVGAGVGDGEQEEYKLGTSVSRQSTPGGTTRALSAVDRFRLTREGEAAEGGRGAPSRPHAMHAMGGALMKEWAAALEKEVAARRVIEQELHDLHESDDKLREWALTELNRLRQFAQSEVDSLAAEVEERNKKMADLKQQRRALELRAKMLESLDEERLNSIVASFRGMQRGTLLRRAFSHWRRESGSMGVMHNKSIENAFARYQAKDYKKNLLKRALEVWRREASKEKRARRVYSSVLNRYCHVAFRTWASEMRSSKLRREIAERIAPSRRIGVHLNNALTIGFQMRGALKQHQFRRCVVAHAQKITGVRVDLVEAAFDCGEEMETAATYALSDSLSDPLGSINLAREAVLRRVSGDDVASGAVVHAFDQGIAVASRMIQVRQSYIWMNADTVEEAAALTVAYDLGESSDNASSQNRAMARGKLIVDVSKLPPRISRLILGAFYRGNFVRDYADSRMSNIDEKDAFCAGLEAGLCQYKRREFTSQARSPEELRLVATAFDGGIAYACLSSTSNSYTKVQMVLDSVEDENQRSVSWMRETLMTTVEVGAGNVASTNTEFLLHKILYPLRTDMMRATLHAWRKKHRESKEDELTVTRFQRRVNRRLVKEALFSWRNSASLNKKRFMILRRVGLRIKTASMAKYFDTWSANVDKLSADRVRLTRFKTRLTHRLLAAAFATWAEVSSKRDDRLEKMANVLNKRMRRFELSKAFAGWADKAFTAISNREKANKFIARYRMRLLTRTLYGWHENAQKSKSNRKKVQKVISRSQNRLAASAFYKWRELVTSKSRQLLLLRRFVDRMRNGVKASAFDKWFEVTQNEKRKRAVITKVFSRIKNEQMAHAFGRWREFAAESYDAKVNLRKIVSRMLRLRLSQSFTLWNENVVELRRQRAVLARFVGRMRNRCVTACFYAWVEALEERKRASKQDAYRDRLVANVLWRTNRSTLRAAMHQWRMVVEERETHRELIRRNLRSKRVALNFFMTWYWDAFDGDIQSTVADMFGQTRSYMNEAFDDFDEGSAQAALNFVGYYDDDKDIVIDSPPPPTWEGDAAGIHDDDDDDDDDDRLFHTPGKVGRRADDQDDFTY
jgi:hypothetical protein